MNYEVNPRATRLAGGDSGHIVSSAFRGIYDHLAPPLRPHRVSWYNLVVPTKHKANPRATKGGRGGGAVQRLILALFAFHTHCQHAIHEPFVPSPRRGRRQSTCGIVLIAATASSCRLPLKNLVMTELLKVIALAIIESLIGFVGDLRFGGRKVCNVWLVLFKRLLDLIPERL